MKKLMWIVSVIPLLFTAVALQFMPDTIPMHSNLAGEIDRWGSKYESYIFPLLILAITLFWHLFTRHFEKKADRAKSDKERAEAQSNAKFLPIVGLSMAVMYTVMQAFILYGSYQTAVTDSTVASVDIAKVSCIILGSIFIVLGNFMPKTRKNYLLGVRISYSMYNDTTWRKSNRFGAIAMIAAGILTVVTSIFLNGNAATVMMLIYLLGATAATLIYAKKVYDIEKQKTA